MSSKNTNHPGVGSTGRKSTTKKKTTTTGRRGNPIPPPGDALLQPPPAAFGPPPQRQQLQQQHQYHQQPPSHSSSSAPSGYPHSHNAFGYPGWGGGGGEMGGPPSSAFSFGAPSAQQQPPQAQGYGSYYLAQQQQQQAHSSFPSSVRPAPPPPAPWDHTIPVPPPPPAASQPQQQQQHSFPGSHISSFRGSSYGYDASKSSGAAKKYNPPGGAAPAAAAPAAKYPPGMQPRMGGPYDQDNTTIQPQQPQQPHRPHQGKNPAAKKRRPGRPVGSTKRALAERGSKSMTGSGSGSGKRMAARRASASSAISASAAMVGGGGGSSSKSTSRGPRKSFGTHLQQQQQQGNRSQPSSSMTTSSQRGSSGGGGPQIRIVSDEDPARIVNPLLEMPSEASQNEPVHGSELITLTDLVFHRPDTYPLSYLGRLLGFDIPVPSWQPGSAGPTSINNNKNNNDHADGEEETKEDDDRPLFAPQPTFPTPLPDIATLPLLKSTPAEDVFLQIPPAGRPFYNQQSHLWRKSTKGGASSSSSSSLHRLWMGDTDDQLILQEYIDPVYAHFLQHGFSKSRCKSGTSTLVAKLAAPLHTTRTAIRTSVIELAQSLKLYAKEDWTFTDWSSLTPTTTTTTTTMMTSSTTPHTATADTVTATPAGATTATTTTTLTRPQWTLEDQKIYTTPPTQSFGIVASYQGQPVAMLHYKFQWYQMVESKESELIMVLEGLVKRTGTEVVVPPPPAPIPVPERAMTESMLFGTTMEEIMDVDETPPTKRAGFEPSKPEPEDAKEAAPTKPPPSITVEAAPAAVALPMMEPIEIPEVELDEKVRLILVALALEHARAADVWYCLWNAPAETVQLNESCFRMVQLPKRRFEDMNSSNSVPQQQQGASSSSGLTSTDTVPMICDLKKCNSRYALLRYKELQQQQQQGSSSVDAVAGGAADVETTFRERVLVKLPLLEEAKSCFDAQYAESQRSKRASVTNADSKVFTGASGTARELVVGIRATLRGNDNMSDDDDDPKNDPFLKIQALNEDGEVIDGDELVLNDATEGQRLPPLEIFRRFPLPAEETKHEETEIENEILKELKAKQEMLLQAETALEPRLRSLMSQVVAERVEYEKPEARAKRAEEKILLKRMEQLVERRKELDIAEQEQREQDMNAVCNICNDGEVTPDNQILFCEACDVPVHQMCYGIEEIPEGDYYCIACRYFNRDKMSKEEERTSSTGARIALPPLPICCELCPVKKGAYIRSENSKSEPEGSTAKWVHMACAKWQGLNFVVKNKPDLVEDVSELKKYFRRKEIRCAICQGQRGAYHKCRHEGCEKYLHITCARAVGVCEVVHGEDVEGAVETNPWTLMCPEHSTLDPEEVPKEPVPFERLIEMANELPDDPMPEAPPEPHKPFNKQNGKERKRALADPVYEKEFLDELLTKRFAGLRCEVCWTLEEEGKNLARCVDCSSVICCTCRYPNNDEEVNPEQKRFRCFSCSFVHEKKKADKEYETPHCHLCNDKNGLLLETFANPVNKLSHWKTHEKEFKKTLFAKKLWTHYTCAFWQTDAGVTVLPDGQVDCSSIVMSNGRGYVRANMRCNLCGTTTGLKAKCGDSNCRARGEKNKPYAFHITCARQAGLEVQQEDTHSPPFFVHCYFHGGCEYNLRALVEDLIVAEKRRSGKNFSRSDAPMNFNDGSRSLSHAMYVMRMLGWAWRWAENWVEWDSNWEPLLEPGEEEKNMSRKQLKIVDSTPESRAEDARRCRLAAFGAALRNRAYDTEKGFDNDSLCRALNAILHTRSLVGPLKDFEISFCVDWLARAYRSKSSFLGFGQDKIAVANDHFCIHQADKTPKYELGERPLPGKKPMDPDQVFEEKVEEPDDFLLPELLSDGSKCPYPPNGIQENQRKKIKFKKTTPGEADVSDDEEPPIKASSSTTSTVSKPTTKPIKKEIPTVQKKKTGRPPAREQQFMASPSRFDSVAAMVPSAVKKRGRPQLSRPYIPAASPPSIRKQASVPAIKKTLISKKIKQGIPPLDTLIEYQELLERGNEDSVLRRRGSRGRPPRILELATYVVVGGKGFDPNANYSDDEEDSASYLSEGDASTQETLAMKKSIVQTEEGPINSYEIINPTESQAGEVSTTEKNELQDSPRGTRSDQAPQKADGISVADGDKEKIELKGNQAVTTEKEGEGKTGEPTVEDADEDKSELKESESDTAKEEAEGKAGEPTVDDAGEDKTKSKKSQADIAMGEAPEKANGSTAENVDKEKAEKADESSTKDGNQNKAQLKESPPDAPLGRADESTNDSHREKAESKKSQTGTTKGKAPEKADESTNDSHREKAESKESPVDTAGGGALKGADAPTAEDAEKKNQQDRKTPRNRMLAGLDIAMVGGGGARKRRATDFLNPSEAPIHSKKNKKSSRGDGDDSDKGVRPRPKRKRLEADLDISNIESSNDRNVSRRRSSRNPLSKEMSYKEPDDLLSDLEVESLGADDGAEKRRGRSRPSSAKNEEDETDSRPEKKKRPGRSPTKKRRIIVETDDDSLEKSDDESFHESPSFSDEDDDDNEEVSDDREARRSPRAAVLRLTRRRKAT